MTQIINTILSFGTLVLQILSVSIIIGIITKDKSRFYSFLADKALFFVILGSLGSALMSIVYSNIIGFSPCTLCWFQRIFMYPIAVISIVALVKKYNSEFWTNAKVLSIIGGIIALYHVLNRFIGKEIIPCSASGPSCLQDLFKIFGYIDIPVMSLTAFVFILLIIINKGRFSKNS